MNIRIQSQMGVSFCRRYKNQKSVSKTHLLKELMLNYLINFDKETININIIIFA